MFWFIVALVVCLSMFAAGALGIAFNLAVAFCVFLVAVAVVIRKLCILAGDTIVDGDL
jgi:hypothetical protein